MSCGYKLYFYRLSYNPTSVHLVGRLIQWRFLKLLGKALVSLLRAIVSMDILNHKGKRLDDLSEHGEKEWS